MKYILLFVAFIAITYAWESPDCEDGYWGVDCDKLCSPGCKDIRGADVCDWDNADCDCEAGWWGYHWNDNTGGEYPVYCHSQCPENCKKNSRDIPKCHVRNGKCKGCEEGYWGDSCDKECPDGCLDENCNQRSGKCEGECKDGYWGKKCDKECDEDCEDGKCRKWSGYCEKTPPPDDEPPTCPEETHFINSDGDCVSCGPGCKEDTCDRDTGYCDCKDEYFGKSMDDPNELGQWCHSTCSDNCMEREEGERSCQEWSGRCRGCKPGFRGEFCELECPEGCFNNICDQGDSTTTNGDRPWEGKCRDCEDPTRWGDQCERYCEETSDNCRDNKCDQETGECRRCEIGYWGPECKEICPSGCLYDKCIQETGFCAECKEGLFGDECDGQSDDPESCPQGRFVNELNECIDCGDYCVYDICAIDGFCECKPDTFGSAENDPEPEKGRYCHSQCSENCRESTGRDCGEWTGECRGCKAGYWGFHCEKECPSSNCDDNECLQDDDDNGICDGCIAGYWGDYCDQECSSNCRYSKCHQDSGDCRRCARGYWGEPDCSNTCNPGCLYDLCEMDTGYCPCKEGYSGDSCEHQIV